jgi:GDP-4-dehydro-6-deoxy-D-mannose reductase
LRALITGATGFAGGWLARACSDAGDTVVGVSRSTAVDLLDFDAVQGVVESAAPDVVYHLAALSSVGRSWDEPSRTLVDNVTTAVNVLEAVRARAPRARVVWVSTCEVYGAPERLPVTEDAPLKPANPYAVSKASGDLLAAVYAEAHGLDIVRVRPFNHAGPGQLPIFIVSSLAQQAAQARLAGLESIQIVTGNPDTRRDFTDVRDVVRAYRMLAERGAPGIYNLGSGRSVSAAEQVALIAEAIAPIRIEHVVDPDRVRAHEVMDIYGSHDRLTAATGWEPEIPLRQTIADTIDYWERERSALPR